MSPTPTQASTPKITGFILAGGASRRLGRDKRLVRVGETLLERTRRILREALDQEPLLVGDNLEGLASDEPEGPETEPPLASGDAFLGSGPLGGSASGPASVIRQVPPGRELLGGSASDLAPAIRDALPGNGRLARVVVDPLRIIRDALPGRGPLGGLVAALERCPTPWALALAVDFLFLEARDIRRLVDAPLEGCDVVALSLEGRPEPLAALYRREGLAYWRERLDRGQDSIYQGIVDLRWLAVAPAGGPRALRNLNEESDLLLLSMEGRRRGD